MLCSRVLCALCLMTLLFVPARNVQALVWDIQTVASGSNYSGDVSHATFGGWLPAVTWYDASLGDLKFASRSLFGWITETIDDGNASRVPANVGSHNDLAIDASNLPHVCYYNSQTTSLQYARRNASGVWQTEQVDNAFDGTTVGHRCSIATSTFFKSPHISYLDATNSRLRHATRFGTLPWVITVLDPSTSVAGATSIAIGGPDVESVHISYYDISNKNLKYAIWKNGLWNWGPVDTPGSVGFTSAIAVDAAGRAHIAYSDSTNKRLKYAVSNPSVVGGFAISVVDSLGEPEYCSIAVTPDGQPHIAYRRAATQDLMYAVRKTGVVFPYWVRETVDSTGDTGHSPAIQLNALQQPFIAYRRDGTERVYFAVGQ